MPKIKLTKPAIVAGIAYDKDDIVEVSEFTADWLSKHSVGERQVKQQVKRAKEPEPTEDDFLTS